MSDTVFRTKQEAPVVEEPKIETKSEPTPGIVNDVELPYLDKAEGFLEEYFGIGTEWKDYDASFYPEVEKINTFIKLKIRNGEIPNDQEAVRDFLKGLEKTNNLKKESRSVVKLEVLANYTEFLMKNDKLKSNLKRYAD